jgi:hypothetical protein
VTIGVLGGVGPSTFPVDDRNFSIKYDGIADALFPRDQLRLYKRAAASGRRLADFNVILQASSASPDSLSGWLPDVHPTEVGYRSGSGDSGSTFIIELSPEHRCTGEVDTASEAGRPLALFVPGTPYYAQVHAGRFEFVGLPAGRLPLRWLTAEGRVFAVAESLGLAGDGPTPASYSLPGPLHAGARLDSIRMPSPFPTLAPPTADPAGQYSFSDSVVVTLKSPEAGASVYYTLDGTTPTQDSKRYANPLVLRASATLKAVAYARGYNPSPVAINNYVLAPAPPVIAPAAGQYVDSVVVRITGPAGGEVRYTVDGSLPTATAGLSYTGPFVLHASTLVQAISLAPGLGSSPVVAAQYVIPLDSAGTPPSHP